MTNRCIMITPAFSNMPVIDEIRSQYDPIARLVRPHITLVFPFESDIPTASLKAHMEGELFAIKPFEIILGGVAPSPLSDPYLFLLVQKGTAELTALHERLYTGILSPYYPEWLRGRAYLPHMTIGHFQTQAQLTHALRAVEKSIGQFQSIVQNVNVEIIKEDEPSIPELSIPLKY